MKKLLLVAAATILAACNQGGEANQVLAEANSSGNEATAAVQNAVMQSDATPLQKEQALALMKERHDNYERIGKAMRQAKQGIDTSNLTTVRDAAATINELAPRAEGWFPAGTGPEAGKTEARAEIWQKPREFAAGMAEFRRAAAHFNQVAAGSDLDAIKAAHADLGKTCKSCHDRFRLED